MEFELIYSGGLVLACTGLGELIITFLRTLKPDCLSVVLEVDHGGSFFFFSFKLPELANPIN